MSRWAVPKVDGLRIRILDVKMGRPKGGRLENQDPGCQDAVSRADGLRIRILDVKMSQRRTA